MEIRDLVKNPLGQYVGGQWRDAWWYASMIAIELHDFYTEPCGGLANVLARKEPSFNEVYNDADGGLYNLFSVLQRPSSRDQLIDMIRFTPFGPRSVADAWANEDRSPVRWAWEYMIRLNMALYPFAEEGDPRRFRACRKQDGDPRSTPANKSWGQNVEARLLAFSTRFLKVYLENKSNLADFFCFYDNELAFHMIDPPYFVETRKNKNADYYVHEMKTEKAHRRLAELLWSLKGAVMLCGYTHPLYTELYERRGWRLLTKLSRTNGSGTAVEAVWLNAKAQAHVDYLAMKKREAELANAANQERQLALAF